MSLMVFVLILVLVSPTFALDKVKVSTSLKLAGSYFLPMEAAEEKGFWKAQGLDVEWVPFGGTGAQFVAVAAGASNIGLATVDSPIVASDRGAAVAIVAEYMVMSAFRVWVRAGSPYRHPRELKGAKIGVSRLGGPHHIFGLIVAKAHGIEKEVRFVGAGDLPQLLAGIRAGALDGWLDPISVAVRLKLEGVVREIASLDDYLPQPWPWGNVVFARTDFARANPDLTRRVIKAVLQASDFLNKDRRWALERVKKNLGFSEEAAATVYDSYRFGPSGKIDRRAVDNIRTTFMEYGILTKAVPPVDVLFTLEYLS